ncbi:hypothetical protein [Actinoplanes sp. NBRC 103695]|uniref:hypothetical protein n=1 Tax=Actinoplanes sp. NBRC 103695 TaxID=3032202 RepID=UPI0024A4AADC|nr:hypothetical protein [Actinoplanes sp. NBRC 103695]GLY94234.1 hypothetical protein Acsp02_14900 [Actinoplanes sp. NBRC 103695]
MTDPSVSRPANVPEQRGVPEQQGVPEQRGEQYAEPHDPGAPEEYSGEPVPDPWEEVPSGELDPGSVPGQPAH